MKRIPTVWPLSLLVLCGCPLATTPVSISEVSGRSPENAQFVRFAEGPGFYTITVYTNGTARCMPLVAEVAYVTIGRIGLNGSVFQIECRTMRPDAVLLIGNGTVHDISKVLVRKTKSTPASYPAFPDTAKAAQWPFIEGAGTAVIIPSDATTSIKSIFEAGYDWSEAETRAAFLNLAGENLAVLDAHIANVFSGNPAANDEAVCLELLSYITQTFYAAPVNSQAGIYRHTGTYGLVGMGGACYPRALSLAALIRRCGIPARVLNLPEARHVVAEAYWGGAWRYLDPTYGFVATINDEIISAHALRLATAVTLKCTTTNLWTGTYSAPYNLVTIPPNWSKPSAWPAVPDFFAYYKNAAVSSTASGLPYLSGFAQIRPILLDFSQGETLQLGSNNNDVSDVPNLGDAGNVFSIHALVFKNTPVGTYRIGYKFYREINHLPVVTGAEVLLSTIDQNGLWLCEVFIDDPNQVVLVDQAHVTNGYADAVWAIDSLAVQALAL